MRCLTLTTVTMWALAVSQPASAYQTRMPATVVPSVSEVISLKRIRGTPAISADGEYVAFTVRETDWDADAFTTELWLSHVPTKTTRQLTNGKNSSSAPAWSPDGRSLAFVSDRSDKRQVHLINPLAGEARQLTQESAGVGVFAWSPSGSSIAYTSSLEPAGSTQAASAAWTVVDGERRTSGIYVITVATGGTRLLTEGPFVVDRLRWSPDGTRIAFDHRNTEDPVPAGSSDISLVSVDDVVVRSLVTQAGPDTNPVWSPDGSHIAFETAMADPQFYCSNSRVAVIDASGGPVHNLTAEFDESASLMAWAEAGIFFSASRRTSVCLYCLDPTTRAITCLAPRGDWIGTGYSFTKDYSLVAFVGSDAVTFPEVFVAPTATLERSRVSSLGLQVAGWQLGTREVISWTSTDGTPIEGVLQTMSHSTAAARRPLLVVIRGGPPFTSRTTPLDHPDPYPITQYLARDALVLEPNYRGSGGYGERFRSLNYRNLGVGDAGDVLSGIDELADREQIDRDRVGVMGWSQGGYIAAFLATHDSVRFKAASVGAAISDWTTYCAGTDLQPFTKQYLGAWPWEEPDIYRTTSPITYVTSATTPTLIQHGEFDPRVPILNAHELYRGLKQHGVPTRLIIYRGLGHSLTTPSALRAAAEHNLEWFDRYLWFVDRKTFETEDTKRLKHD